MATFLVGLIIGIVLTVCAEIIIIIISEDEKDRDDGIDPE